VFLFHSYLSLGFDAYEKIMWLDTVMHFIGGVAIACFITQTVIQLDKNSILDAGSSISFFLLSLGLIAASTVLWEFAEFITDRCFDLNTQVSVTNVMKDQFLGMIGGFMYLILYKPHMQLGR